MIIADTVNIGFDISSATQAVSLWHDGPPDERNSQVISCQAFSPQWPMNTRDPRVSVHGRTIFLMHINEGSDIIYYYHCANESTLQSNNDCFFNMR